MLNLLSLCLGLCAWVLGLTAIGKKGSRRMSLGSFSCCALVLVLELFEVRRRVALQDWAALEDTIPAVTMAAVVLLAATVALNGVALCRADKK